MREAAPQTVYLKDYTPPAHLVDRVELDLDLREADAEVRAKLAVRANPASAPGQPLVLDGEDLELRSIAIDGRALAAGEYALAAGTLTIAAPPAAFALEVVTRIMPRKNTRLEGLYATASGFFTQCEAQGFRRITWFPDRPDVMARYTVTIHGDRDSTPVLLSNGNLVDAGEEPGGRHWARWEDPHPKPSYLFAMVAARLDVLEDEFVTRSGRRVRLGLYVEPGRLDTVAFAMECLKRAMRWDEERFGLEVDLDRYMIVAVNDFNSGAMENKGLNIFNARYLLARPDLSTDVDFQNVDRVIAHEYFHNWTGNRVTCRDWFQLSLKEGLTVYRDQEYGADTYSRAVSRIQEVRNLRGLQFPEDAGPMAHPVRPSSYMEIRNFYTMTVYEKGAELCRMLAMLVGRDGFRRGMDLYFARHDGQAVTCEDFVAAIADANGFDAHRFLRWYEQAGTPRLDCEGRHDAAAQRYTLTVRQSCPPTPGQPDKQPFHIPLALALVGRDGHDLPGTARIASITESRQTLVFENVTEAPVPSLLRDFSAPVILRFPYSKGELAFLAAHDTDPFNRWEALQRLAADLILAALAEQRAGRGWRVDAEFLAACLRVLDTATADPAFAAEALTLPSEIYLAEQLDEVDPEALHTVRIGFRRAIAEAMRPAFEDLYRRLTSDAPYAPDARQAGRRALRNLALGYLMEPGCDETRRQCLAQFDSADNMTDRMAALGALAGDDSPARIAALERFYAMAKGEPLLIDKWLAVQATSRLPGTLAEVRRLTGHEAFDLRIPNRVYALVRAFSQANHVRFHAADGGGYAFLADQVIALDAVNPQVAARMARGFDRWRRFDAGRQAHAHTALARIRDRDGLSKDVAEIVIRTLGEAGS